MHLINTETLTLKEWIGSTAPSYAILSHTWGTEEIEFGDLNGHVSPAVHAKAGYTKVEQFCRIAREEGYEWAWCDTCCINKKSSAELSEAINSMYKWYQDAVVCYVYLEDVKGDDSTAGLYPPPEQWRRWERSLENSRWFTRGWTLQELLAPSNVYFYDSSWYCFASKRTVADTVSRITEIAVEVLTDVNFQPSRYCAAVRMSWAANRETTRLEDRAYSLFGLFDISLPLLYGEGCNAFTRLQEAVLIRDQDCSLLAWIHSYSGYNTDYTRHPLLAPSPDGFRVSNSTPPVFKSYSDLEKGSPAGISELNPTVLFHSVELQRAKFKYGDLFLRLPAILPLSTLRAGQRASYLASLNIYIPSTQQLVCLRLADTKYSARREKRYISVDVHGPGISLVSFDDMKKHKLTFVCTDFLIVNVPDRQRLPKPLTRVVLLQTISGVRSQSAGILRFSPLFYPLEGRLIIELIYKRITFCVGYVCEVSGCSLHHLALYLGRATEVLEAFGRDEINLSMSRNDVAWLGLDKGIWGKAEYKIGPKTVPQDQGIRNKKSVACKLIISVEGMRNVEIDESLEIIQARVVQSESGIPTLGRHVFEATGIEEGRQIVSR